MKKLFTITAAAFVLTAVPVAIANSVFEHEFKLRELSDRWHALEQQQRELHEEANDIRHELCKAGVWDYCITDPERTAVVFATWYNAVPEQTDASPCIGAGLTNICELQKNGERILALSPDLVGRASWKKFTYGDYVVMEHDKPHCSGVFRVEDVMAADKRNQADILISDPNTKPGNCAGAKITAINI